MSWLWTCLKEFLRRLRRGKGLWELGTSLGEESEVVLGSEVPVGRGARKARTTRSGRWLFLQHSQIRPDRRLESLSHRFQVGDWKRDLRYESLSRTRTQLERERLRELERDLRNSRESSKRGNTATWRIPSRIYIPSEKVRLARAFRVLDQTPKRSSKRVFGSAFERDARKSARLRFDLFWSESATEMFRSSARPLPTPLACWDL